MRGYRFIVIGLVGLICSIVGLVLVSSQRAESQAQPGINVIAGTYGGNCGQPRGNVTNDLAQTCNGQSTCQYSVDYTRIGDPAVGCRKDYVAEWSCPDGTGGTASAQPEAGYGSTVTLACQGGATTQPAGNFAGTWLFRGVAGQVCTIQQYTDGTIVATSETGDTGQGKVLSAQEFYVDMPGASGLRGDLSADGNTITWSNGEHWMRAGTTYAAPPPTDELGSWWDEYEVSGWHGTWTREPGTTIFDLSFVNPNGMTIGGQAQVADNGGAIAIHRWNPGGPETCDYTGTLAGNTLTGTYTCTLNGGVVGPYAWSATVMP